MILQLSPPLHMQTPKGPGWAHFVLDYGPEHDAIWVVFLDANGACWWVPNPEVKLSPNWTMGRRPDDPMKCGRCGAPLSDRHAPCTQCVPTRQRVGPHSVAHCGLCDRRSPQQCGRSNCPWEFI